MKKEYNGLLIINKPKNYTSRDVVNKLVRILGTKKIGHTGTLDPLASGVLVCTIGKCTKLTEYLTATYKEYVAEFKIGFETDTLDITGNITNKSNDKYNKDDILKVVKQFEGKYLQTVPAYSAVKINGKKLYEYARENIKIELPKRLVDIKNINVIDINNDTVKIKCLVSKGTYIRSLIRDIGYSLGTYATMTDLVRIKQGNFNLKDSYTLQDIEINNYKLIEPEEIFNNLKNIECDEKLLKEILNGVVQKLNISDDYVVYKYNNKIVALYKKENDKFRMYVMF